MAAARVAYLATVDADRRPHVVPVTFAFDRERLVTAIDRKPKTTVDLRRLRNIAENPRVALLCDHYHEDWQRLWWVRADGAASIIDDGTVRDAAVERLMAKYPQYANHAPPGPAIVVTIESWSGWAYGPP